MQQECTYEQRTKSSEESRRRGSPPFAFQLSADPPIWWHHHLAGRALRGLRSVEPALSRLQQLHEHHAAGGGDCRCRLWHDLCDPARRNRPVDRFDHRGFRHGGSASLCHGFRLRADCCFHPCSGRHHGRTEWCAFGKADAAILHRDGRNNGHLSRHGQPADQWRA